MPVIPLHRQGYLILGLAHLVTAHLERQVGQLIAVHDLSAGEHGLDSGHPTQQAVIHHRQLEKARYHAHIHHPVVRLKSCSHGADIREVFRKGLLFSFPRLFYVQTGVLHLRVILQSHFPAFFQR